MELKVLIGHIKKNFRLILIGAAIGVMVAGVFSFFNRQPSYQLSYPLYIQTTSLLAGTNNSNPTDTVIGLLRYSLANHPTIKSPLEVKKVTDKVILLSVRGLNKESLQQDLAAYLDQARLILSQLTQNEPQQLELVRITNDELLTVSAPKTLLNLGIGLLLGVVGSLVAIFLKIYFRN